ncbi:unnamed protein product [Cuscuta epithymum]|uniref:Protein kinase domain-containing protein n=1 Tax=Cuscuta epithymum TaxID=186058 RepID=A0AAV0G3C1_9ASTE|nr:unnamed protein product [Cuscuta epithymum]CAH9142069.1 unnamed protein product [Cuscuta epithymum]
MGEGDNLRMNNNVVLLFTTGVLLFLSFLQVAGSSRSWDGVMVTAKDYTALSGLKNELIDFRGVLKSWNGSGGMTGACSGGWVGIKCVKGQVIAIQLPWKGLGGRISEKIGELKALRKFSLHDNVLAGSIPTSLGFLPNLRGLYLFNNRLSGFIPPSLGRCPLLQTLDLSNNQFNGTIPPTLSNPSNLYRFNLSFNALSGSIPVSLTQSSSLVFLSLHQNNLSGSIPDTWGGSSNSSNKLQTLTLDHNLLSGRIPASLSRLGLVEEINLSHNQISGTIPDELGSHLSRLLVLDLSHNAISGGFPSTFSKLTALKTLNLNNNKLTGQLPVNIGNLSGLILLDLSKNNLSGEIPDSIGSLGNLTSLNVSYNDLSGSVPILLSKKYNSSAFVGNIQLCGYTPSIPCPSPPPSQNLPSSSSKGASSVQHRKVSTKDIILILAGVLSIILLLLCCILLICLIKKKVSSKHRTSEKAATEGAVASSGKATSENEGSGGGEGGGGGKLVHFDGAFVFTADDLLCATAEIMGKSTYGTAYKATLEDGNQVAVKRLREKITKGYKEFEHEVSDLGKIRHPNILALRAYYLGPKGEKLLVYDYISNGSLSSFLHARGPETAIDWATRMSIIMGITRGVCYLHAKENAIVHGNLSSSNILLDEWNNPKIGDVGLSRLMTNAGNTNVIATAGTLGYRAPEFSKLKNASTKTDVYSLGVIMLELLTGKSPSESTGGLDLPGWVASIVKEEWTNEVFDVELMRDVASAGEELLNTLKLALHCVDPTPGTRPEAQQVIERLEEIKPELAAAPSSSATTNPSSPAAVQERTDDE